MNGPSGSADQKVSNAKEMVKDAAAATAEAAKAKRDEYAREMSKQLDDLNVKYEELKSRADKAEGQAKTEPPAPAGASHDDRSDGSSNLLQRPPA